MSSHDRLSFSNRTLATAFLLTFASSILLQALSYFLPVYFQAVQHTTVLELHAVAFALASVAFGLFTLLGPNTSKVTYVWLELIAGAGIGAVMSVLLPAIMAPLPESYVASSSATYSFVRTFGYIWGINIPSLIFNAVYDHHLSTISDPAVQSRLRGGAAYAFASQAHTLRDAFDPVVWDQVITVYVKSFKAIWWVCLGLVCLVS